MQTDTLPLVTLGYHFRKQQHGQRTSHTTHFLVPLQGCSRIIERWLPCAGLATREQVWQAASCHHDSRRVSPAPLASNGFVDVAVRLRGFTMEAAIDIPFNNVNYYLENGFIVISLEYRLMPQ